MTSVNVSESTNTVTVTTGDSKTAVVSVPVTTVVTATATGPQGPQGPAGPSGSSSIGSPTFIQATQPTSGELGGATKYAWWETAEVEPLLLEESPFNDLYTLGCSSDDLTLWIEDGI
jgi:hypothetical protein